MNREIPETQHSTGDEEALNAYLDARAGYAYQDADGLDSGLKVDVDAFFDLARRAGAGVLAEGSPIMQRAPSLRISDGTRGDSSGGTPHGETGLGRDGMRHRPAPWLSVAVVAVLLMGTVGGAWWFGPGRGNDEPIQLAALVNDEGTPEPFWPDPLNPVDDPWVAAILPEECTAEPMPYEDFAAAKTTDPGPPSGSSEIVDLPNQEDAEAVVSTVRGWLACADLGYLDRQRAYTTDAYLFFQGASIDNQRYTSQLEQRDANASVAWTQWAEQSGFYPITLIEGVEPPAAALESFAYAQSLIDARQPGDPPPGGVWVAPDGTVSPYSEARVDPSEAVVLADGRIMIPIQYGYWAADPWVRQVGFGAPGKINTVVMALVLEEMNGEWKIDQTADLFLCDGGCDLSKIEQGTSPWPDLIATPAATPKP